jgi:hypothetical protein
VSATNAYAESDAVRLLRSSAGPIRIAFLDIDSTLTGDAAGVDRVRDQLQSMGYVCAFVTSRTEEMVMSARALRASRKRGELCRPEPHLGRRGELRFYQTPERVAPRGILDGEIIAGSSGSRIYVRQGSGYRLDRGFGLVEDEEGGSRSAPTRAASTRAAPTRLMLAPEAWREEALGLIAELNGADPLAEPAGIEWAESYESGSADVFPPDYRIQLHFSSETAKKRFVHSLSCRRRGPWGEFARSLRLLDDSHPAQEHYKAFLLPRWASKARAVTRIVDSLRAHLPAGRPVDLLFAGDSYPDLEMGLLGAPGCTGTLLLVGGSRLVRDLLSPESSAFAGEPLTAIKRRLRATDRSGVYRFRVPRHPHAERRVIVADIAFPGCGAVRSIERYLESLSTS